MKVLSKKEKDKQEAKIKQNMRKQQVAKETAKKIREIK